jgi:hypothetical protein
MLAKFWKKNKYSVTDLLSFRLPQSKITDDWDVSKGFMKYDSAHRTKKTCSELYPSCFKDLDVS